MAHSIIVGIDFTPTSRVALAQAIRLATRDGASVRAVHVIDTLVAMDMEEVLSGYVKGVRENLIKDARSGWPGFIAGLAGAENAAFDVRINNRLLGLAAEVKDFGADLIVLGANGLGKVDVGIGSAATACVRRCPANVLLVRESQTGPFRRVVACVDFSPTSIRALRHAAALATAEGAELRVVHVFDPPWTHLHYRMGTPEATPDFQIAYRAALERRLKATAEEAGVKGAICDVFASSGGRSGIVEYAGSVQADLLVLGTRGRTNLRDMLLGSTAEKALRESTCSVLAVKPTAEDLRLTEAQHPPQAGAPGSAPTRPAF